jgi:hypothetical protein
VAQVYSHQFYADGTLNGVASAGVVPGTEVWIVRDIEFVLPALEGPAGTFVWLASGALIVYKILTGPEWFQWQGRAVLEPGDELMITTNATTSVLVSGYVLTLP